jgi:hypothetical protein
MHHKGGALALLAQDGAQAEHWKSMSRAVIFTRDTSGSEPSVLQAWLRVSMIASLRRAQELGWGGHSAGVAATAFSFEGSTADKIAADRLRPKRKTATIVEAIATVGDNRQSDRFTCPFRKSYPDVIVCAKNFVRSGPPPLQREAEGQRTFYRLSSLDPCIDST